MVDRTKRLDLILNNIINKINDNKYLFDNPSVEDGTMGIAIFYMLCYNTYNDMIYYERVSQIIESSIIRLTEICKQPEYQPKYTGDSLLNLISSFGKGLLFVEHRLNFCYDFKEYHDAIDDVIVELTNKSIMSCDFDFFSGALASGHYYINKYNIYRDDLSKKMLLDIYNAIVKSAIYKSHNEIYWSAPAYNNLVYIGLSHGSAMIINFIVKLIELDILSNDIKSAKRVLEYAINFILFNKKKSQPDFFPNFYNVKTNDKIPSIYALCYGDLGVLYALKTANNYTPCPLTYAKEIEKMLVKCSKRKKNIIYTCDASLFYGSTGIYLTYKSLHKKLKKNYLKKSEKYWFEQTLTYTSINGISSDFIFMSNNSDNQIYLRYSLGWGLLGVGVAVIYEQNEGLPLFDELLLIGL